MFFNGNKIKTFREVFDWIVYDWDHLYTLFKDKDGIYCVNKLYIGPNYLQYKTECYELAEGLYDRVGQLYKIMQETPRESDEDAYNRLVDWIQSKLDSDELTGSFSLEKVPVEERHRLVKDFKKKGYNTYLYMDNKSIMILEKKDKPETKENI